MRGAALRTTVCSNRRRWVCGGFRGGFVIPARLVVVSDPFCFVSASICVVVVSSPPFCSASVFGSEFFGGGVVSTSSAPSLSSFRLRLGVGRWLWLPAVCFAGGGGSSELDLEFLILCCGVWVVFGSGGGGGWLRWCLAEAFLGLGSCPGAPERARTLGVAEGCSSLLRFAGLWYLVELYCIRC
ncbi:hypothetical protein QL285_093669 [Trifolium repens]|nr:hypothetical protein QL285_093669 [Trifolium repens]